VKELFLGLITALFFGYVACSGLSGCGETYIDSRGEIHEYSASDATIVLLLIPFQRQIGRAYHASCLFFGKNLC
jgi:hypothetical protein